MTEREHYPDGIGLTTLENEPSDNFPEKSTYKIHGVAIPENTVLQGGRGVKHFYPPEMAEEAAEVMKKQIKQDGKTFHLVSGFHELEGQADPEQVVGEITSAGYQKGVGVVFEGETIDEEVANRISHGYVDVSPTVARSLGEYSETMGAQAVDRVSHFRDIAVVARGQEGAEVSIGANPAVEALSLDALSNGFDVLDSDETDEEPDEPAESGDESEGETELEEPESEAEDSPDAEIIPVVESVPVEERAGGETVTLQET